MVVFLLSVGWSLALGQPAPPLENIGYVTLLEGHVSVLRGQQTTAMVLGQEVYSGDTIVTAMDGTVGLTLVDHSHFQVGKKTRLRLWNFHARIMAHQKTRESHATLEHGRVVVHAGDAKVSLTTPNATISAMNTQLAVEVQ